MKYPILFLLLAITVACLQPPDYPDEPRIEYIGLNKNVIRQGSFGAQADTLIISFSYTDGDGDIGAPSETEFDNNIIYIDSRNGLEQFSGVPFIPDLGGDQGINGRIAFEIFSTNQGVCCVFDDKDSEDPCTRSTAFPTDTMTYTIYLVDQNGNESNRIETEPIILLCN